MYIRSKAPLRISFCGGGTDVSPYPEERGGVVLSTTIDKYAYGSLRPTGDGKISVASLDYDVVAKYKADDELLYDGELDLVKAVIKKMGSTQGLELFLHSDAPPGSGLGSSSTMVVCLIGLFKHWLKRPLTDYEIAELAYEVERIDLGIKGGMQDQYAATFGGFNFIEFLGETVVVNPLRIKPDILNELNYRLLLCYTGRTRLSAHILEHQTDAYIQKKEEVVEALDALKDLTIEMKNSLLQGRLNDFGDLLHEAWLSKKKLDANISSLQIDELYEAARERGAVGGKILGAGGGGYLLVFCPFDKKHAIAERLEQVGGQVVEFAFDFAGLQTWEAA
ncbi:MAG: GHMP kinase [Actinobacteria bacterium]|nr:GHMP kinase [Actinomycetota bacterium]